MARIAEGRAGMITERDLELLRALAFCPLLSTDQVFRLDLPGAHPANLKVARARGIQVPSRGFISPNRTRKRMYLLKDKGYVSPYKPSATWPTLWRLTPEGHKNLVKTRLDLERRFDVLLEYSDYEPDPVRVAHHLQVTEIFTKIQPLLTSLYGSLPAWEWREERRAYASWTVGGRLGTTHYYKPDAEIEFADMLLIVERQTASPHKSAEEIHRKIESHVQYLRYIGRSPESARTIFAADNDRDAFAAEQAGEHHGMNVLAGTPRQMLARIYETAHIEHDRHNNNRRSRDGSAGAATRSSTPRTTAPQQPPYYEEDPDFEQFTEVPF